MSKLYLGRLLACIAYVMGVIVIVVTNPIFLSQNVGSFWYLLSVERENDCWHLACKNYNGCLDSYLYCGNRHLNGYDTWLNVSNQVLGNQCPNNGSTQPFNFGIYAQCLQSGVVQSKKFVSKLSFCFWWGLQTLR